MRSRRRPLSPPGPPDSCRMMLRFKKSPASMSCSLTTFSTSSLLKKAYLPSAGLGAPLRPDAIQSSYARQTADSTSVLRLPLHVRCIGPSSYPQAGGYDSGVRPSRLDFVACYWLTRLLD